MTRSLCEIYNLRTGFIGTAYLFCCIFTNTYVAGKLDEYESEIGKSVVDIIGNHTSIMDFLPNAVQESGKALLGAAIGKTTTGMANYLLIGRLGYRTMQMLKPLR